MKEQTFCQNTRFIPALIPKNLVCSTKIQFIPKTKSGLLREKRGSLQGLNRFFPVNATLEQSHEEHK